jgi:hypothetical protein
LLRSTPEKIPTLEGEPVEVPLMPPHRSALWTTTATSPDARVTLTRAARGYQTTPAMAAGIERRVWTHRDIAALLD